MRPQHSLGGRFSLSLTLDDEGLVVLIHSHGHLQNLIHWIGKFIFHLYCCRNPFYYVLIDIGRVSNLSSSLVQRKIQIISFKIRLIPLQCFFLQTDMQEIHFSLCNICIISLIWTSRYHKNSSKLIWELFYEIKYCILKKQYRYYLHFFLHTCLYIITTAMVNVWMNLIEIHNILITTSSPNRVSL